MSDNNITTEMFKILIGAFTSEMKDIKIEVKETNTLLREDINTQKLTLQQQIKEYNSNKVENDKKFTTIFKVLRSREGVYRAAKLIKWSGAILFAGLLTAAGASIWSHYSITADKVEIKAEVVE